MVIFVRRIIEAKLKSILFMEPKNVVLFVLNKVRLSRDKFKFIC